MNNHQSVNQVLSRIKEVLIKNNVGIIIIPQNPSVDTVCAALSLSLAIEKMSKSVAVVCSNQNINDQNIIGLDKIKNNLSINGNSLVISFPYVEGAIDKVDVDYQIENNNFNLIVTPRTGYPKIDPNQVRFSYTGGSFDFIIVLDSPNLNSLGSLYQNNQNQFIGKEIINIDRHLTNNNYGTINLVNKTISSISEVIFKLIEFLEIPIDKDIATNLYYGLVSATNNFSSYSTSADSFEIASKLLRFGAIKKVFKTVKMAESPFTSSPTPPPPSFIPFQKKPIEPNKPIEGVEREPVLQEQKTPPQDWLKPKIFKGRGLI